MPTRTPRSAPAPITPDAPSVVAEPSPPAPATEGSGPPATTIPLYGYRGLKVWQRAMDLATAILAVTRSFAPDDAVLRDELRLAAIAVPSNIAAGNTLYVRTEYVQHLSEAHGKVARLECLLQIAERLGALPPRDSAPLASLAGDVGRMLRGLARALSSPRDSEPATEAAAD